MILHAAQLDFFLLFTPFDYIGICRLHSLDPLPHEVDVFELLRAVVDENLPCLLKALVRQLVEGNRCSLLLSSTAPSRADRCISRLEELPFFAYGRHRSGIERRLC